MPSTTRVDPRQFLLIVLLPALGLRIAPIFSLDRPRVILRSETEQIAASQLSRTCSATHSGTPDAS